jgi:hypothetical protein
VRVLFIVKKRADYCHEYGQGYGQCDALGGLYNSARFVVQMLNKNGVTAALVQVVDNNDIDREVAKFKPDIAIIEALWVVPEKFEILAKLHPTVKWVVRIHSEIPFLAVEGVAIDWICDYVTEKNVTVAANSIRATDDLRAAISAKRPDVFVDSMVAYLPNWYPITRVPKPTPNPSILNIACFGAIRPLKNQLIQALAAIEFAQRTRKNLHFHINGTRCEQHGDNVLRNIQALFAGTPYTLIEHGWESHDDFLQSMAGMDVAMAVSFSETFNITTADAVNDSVPIVVSSEVAWASPQCFADPNNAPSIVALLDKVTNEPDKSKLVAANLQLLNDYDVASTRTWLAYLKANA